MDLFNENFHLNANNTVVIYCCEIYLGSDLSSIRLPLGGSRLLLFISNELQNYKGFLSH